MAISLYLSLRQKMGGDVSLRPLQFKTTLYKMEDRIDEIRS